jgi:chromosome segregation ATPase
VQFALKIPKCHTFDTLTDALLSAETNQVEKPRDATPKNLNLVEDLIAYVRKLETSIQTEVAKLDRAHSERQVLVAQLHKARIDLTKATQQFEQLSSEKSAVDELLVDAKRSLQLRERRVLELELQVSQSQTRLQELESRRADENRRSQALIQNQKERSSDQSVQFHQEREKLIAERDALIESRARLQAELKDLHDKDRASSMIHDQMEASLERLVRTKDELEVSNSALSAQAGRMQATIDLLEGKLLDLRRNQTGGLEQARKFEDRAHIIEMQLTKAQHRVRTLEESERLLLEKCAALEDQLRWAKTDLSREKENQSFALEEFERMRRRLRTLEMTGPSA